MQETPNPLPPPSLPEPPRDPVDEALEESFPASDPPGWVPLHPGPPGDHMERVETNLSEAMRTAPSCGPEEAVECLFGVTQELAATRDLAEGLRRVAERLRPFLDFDTFGVLLLDEMGRELRFVVAVGYPPEVAAHWRFGMGQGIVGTAALTREPVLVGDVRQDPRFIDAGEQARSELAIPLVSKDRTVGVLDVASARPHHFTAEHQRLLAFLGGHLASAIENAQLYQNTREQARTLSLLHEVSRELNSILDRGRLLERVAELVKRLIDYDLFSVLLWNEQRRLLEPWLAVHGDGLRAALAGPVALGQGLCGTAAALRLPVRVPNVHVDPRYVACGTLVEIRSELVVPLVQKDRLVGVLDLESGRYDAFGARDEQLLSTLAASLAIALENARLYEKVLEDERRIQDDLAAAREIQKQLLPKASPWVAGLQVGFAYEPARQLGGDFYDFLMYDDGRLAVAVGDVSGKGTPAALYGSLAMGTLREIAERDLSGPAGVLAEMNCKLRHLGFDNRFLALAFAVWDGPSRTLTLANSGLPHPWRLRGGSVEKIRVEGVPLGLLPDRSYREVSIELQPGDAVVLASDGIEESLDAEGRELGPERIAAALRRRAGDVASAIAEGLLDDSRRFAGDAPAADDRTVVVLKAAI